MRQGTTLAALRRGPSLLATMVLVVGLLAVVEPWTKPAALAATPGARLHTVPRIPMGPATPGAQLWVARYNGPGGGADAATAVAASSDGSMVFVTGQSPGTTSGLDGATVAYDASTGAKLWAKRFNGPSNLDDGFSAVGASPDGSKVFVTGYSTGSTSPSGYEGATVAYNASTGAKLWARLFKSPGNLDAYFAGLGVSPDGSKVFVTGFGTGSTSGRDYATVAYDASTGAKLWARRYNGPGNGEDVTRPLRVSPDGSKVFVTGLSRGSTSGNDYATLAYNASTGAKLWVARYNGPDNGDDNVLSSYALGVSPDGSKVFVTGYTTTIFRAADYATVAYDASTGTQLWATLYDGPAGSNDLAYALGVSPDGSKVFITGLSSEGSNNDDYATVAYDVPTGGQLWARFYNGPPGNGADDAQAMAVSPDGSTVFVTGYSTGSGAGNDYATVAYDASTGAQLWVARYTAGPGSGSDIAYALAVSPDGAKVFVTGPSTGSNNSNTGFDYATVAYSTA